MILKSWVAQRKPRNSNGTFAKGPKRVDPHRTALIFVFRACVRRIREDKEGKQFASDLARSIAPLVGAECLDEYAELVRFRRSQREQK